MSVIKDFTKDSVKMLSDEQLKLFIPDVYQEDVIDIDYNRLWNKGIRLISFDIDDTVMDMLDKIKILDGQPKRAIVDMLENLHSLGFTVVLLTNASESNAARAFKKLNRNGSIAGYISEAGKPDSNGFQKVLNVYGYGLSKENMAHVGNSMRKDIQGGNYFGITTCLVRDIGKLTKVGLGIKKKLGKNPGHFIRHELKNREMWRKHHKFEDNDQYYQLGESPAYKLKI